MTQQEPELTMKAIRTAGLGSATRLVLGDAGCPVPGDTEVLVKVHAASVNPKDFKLNLSLAKVITPLGVRRVSPLFGDDLAGVVVSAGPKVTDFSPGDAVYGMDMSLRTASLAEVAVIDVQRIARKPASLSFQQAAAVPLAAQTALQGLRLGGAGRDSEVLIIGASGGVGTFAVQVAKAMGCRVTAVCSGRNAEFVSGLGADRVIDYTIGDFRQGPGKYDVVFDVTSHETPRGCKSLLRPEGMFVSTAGNGKAIVGVLLAGRRQAAMLRVRSVREDLETLTAWIDAGQLRVVIDSVFDLANSEEAYARSRSGRARGKIVINVVT